MDLVEFVQYSLLETLMFFLFTEWNWKYYLQIPASIHTVWLLTYACFWPIPSFPLAFVFEPQDLRRTHVEDVRLLFLSLLLCISLHLVLLFVFCLSVFSFLQFLLLFLSPDWARCHLDQCHSIAVCASAGGSCWGRSCHRGWRTGPLGGPRSAGCWLCESYSASLCLLFSPTGQGWRECLPCAIVVGGLNGIICGKCWALLERLCYNLKRFTMIPAF